MWQYEVSDEIQSVATAFGHRYLLQGALADLAACQDAKLKQLLTVTIRLHMITQVKQDLAWYLVNGSVSEAAALKIDDEFD